MNFSKVYYLTPFITLALTFLFRGIIRRVANWTTVRGRADVKRYVEVYDDECWPTCTQRVFRLHRRFDVCYGLWPNPYAWPGPDLRAACDQDPPAQEHVGGLDVYVDGVVPTVLPQGHQRLHEIAAALGDPMGVAPDRAECLQDDLWSSLHTLRREQPAFEAWLNVTNVTMVDPSGFNRAFLLEDIDTIVKALDIKKDLAGDLAEVESNIRNKNELKAVALVQATFHRDDLDLRL